MKLWLRDETKENERRTPLTPNDTRKVLEAGVDVVVEESPTRIFATEEYRKLGCKIVPSHSWIEAPNDYVILGLKEIEDSHLFFHKHIYFAHIYKGQSHAKQIISQYQQGGGTLFDLEYLTNEQGRRVCAFGRWAGFAGAAFALDRYFHKQSQQGHYPGLKSFPKLDGLLEQIESNRKQAQQTPTALIIGALGRCGNGAKELFDKFDIPTTLWDYEETKKGGPFAEIAKHNIFLNAALITQEIPPFLTKELVTAEESNLEIVADVSCDPNSDLNPIPIYNHHTTWEKPFLETDYINRLEVLSVDNLPSTLPLESSIDFSEQLTPHLINFLTQLDNYPTEFKNAETIFKQFVN